MLKRSSICIAVLFALHVPHAAAMDKPSTALTQAAYAARIDAAIAPYFKAGDPGATVIVVKDGKTVYRKAYGMADVAKRQPLTPDTALRLGSITKQFTAVAILMLAEEGKIALGDPITKFLPDYPTQGKTITIEHLLTHTSGIASYTGRPGYMLNMHKDLTVAQMIDSFKDAPMDFEPGTDWRYNNSGYFLLGAIIEKVSGKSYADFVAQRIFTPLGMTDTAYEGHERGRAPRAIGYSVAEKGFEPSRPVSMTQPYAAGSLVSTVDDLARWDVAISSGKLIKAASWKRAFTPYEVTTGKPTKYGYGWALSSLRGVPVIGHGGGINGFNTYAARIPGEKVFVAVLSNTDSGPVRAEHVANKVAAIAIGKPYPEMKAVTLDEAKLDAYTGVYEIDKAAKRTFRRENGQLMMQRTGRPAVALQAYSDNGFFVPDSLEKYEFSRNAQGEVSAVTQTVDDVIVVNQRIGALPPPRKTVQVAPAVFDARAGRYEVAPGFEINLTREGERFFAQATRQSKVEIFPASEDVYFYTVVEAELRFQPAANGAPATMTLVQGGREMKGNKVQ
ncbi:MAG TPA: serine hydrolase [Telluria sp.]